MGWWTSSRKAYALNYLINAGLSPYGAAGLVSRWANVESIANGPTAVNPYSGAFGIAQWLGSRLPPIRDNTNFDAQLAYVVQELNGSEYRAAQVLRSAQTAYEGARGASIYERAEGYNANSGVDNFTARTAAGIPAILGLLVGNSAANNVSLNPVIPFPGTTNANGDLESFVNTNSLGAIDGVSALTVVAVGAGVLAIYLLTE